MVMEIHIYELVNIGKLELDKMEVIMARDKVKHTEMEITQEMEDNPLILTITQLLIALSL